MFTFFSLIHLLEGALRSSDIPLKVLSRISDCLIRLIVRRVRKRRLNIELLSNFERVFICPLRAFIGIDFQQLLEREVI